MIGQLPAAGNVRIAVVHEWLVDYFGSERALEQILSIFPNADLFCVVDYLPSHLRRVVSNKKTRTTFIQKLPFARRFFRAYLPLMPMAVGRLDISAYDLVISSSHAVAKGVRTHPGQLHISYVYTPMRYAWDMQAQYLSQSRWNSVGTNWIARKLLESLKSWDRKASGQVQEFVAISDFIRQRIRHAYGRDAAVIYPPVDVESFAFSASKEDFYLTASRLVPYKRIDLIVDAFSMMPDRSLVVIGDGPDMGRIRRIAGPNVSLLGHLPAGELKSYLHRARAFLFAAEEDFGIAPVEAQASGTPVIAYGRGGVLETIHGLDADRPTGLFFENQTSDDIVRAVRAFEVLPRGVSPEHCRENATRFGTDRFRREFETFVNDKWRTFCERRTAEGLSKLRSA